MKGRTIQSTVLSLFVGLTAFAFIWLGLHQARANSPAGSEAQLGRPEDPVVVTGDELPLFDGQPIDEMVLYKFSSGSWAPIPFQIDERANDITGTYVVFEDGLLDANDELVFMAKDAGEMAGSSWPADMEAQQNPRYQIAASDPLSPANMGTAYLYRSTTLPASPDSYVDWNEGLQTVTTISYTAAFSPSSFVGLADLTVNGNGVDILDRQKIRITAFIISLNEEDLITLITPTISIPVVGPVRGVANGGAFNVSIYGSRLEFFVVFDTSSLPISIDDIRTSFDLKDSAVTGISNYYDSNGTAAAIDGLPDAVPGSPRFDWYQASGSVGGLVMAVPVLNTGGGSVTNYYKDDSAVDAGDTGDQQSYGDTGVFITNPGSEVELALVSYILPPGSTANVGQEYFDRATNPLTAATTAQLFGLDFPNYLPVILKP